MIISRIKKKVIEVETRPVILHEIPGRVRFGIKVLKRMKKESLPLADHLKSVIEEIPAIDEIKLNIASGSMLIKFDKEKTDSKKVQRFIKDVIRYLLKYSDSILAIDEKHMPEVLERLSRHIKTQTAEDLAFNAADIPAEVWKV